MGNKQEILKMKRVKNLVVGCGLTGMVLAERLASELKEEVLIIDRRSHIGGNIYDYKDESGVTVHQYGPHVFHTKDKKVWDYLGRFTDWHYFMYRVKAVIDGREVNVPFNLDSLHQVFPRQLAERLEEKLIAKFGFNRKVPILKLRQTDDGDFARLADYVYEKVFLGYTVKQWGVRPEELDPSVSGRVPVFVSRDDRYFQDKYQAIPAEGYTKMAERMLDNPLIRTELNTDFNDVRGSTDYERLFYTGPIDEFFDFELGELPYRSLDIVFRRHDRAFYQSGPQINYPENYDFTRSVEYKYYLDEQTAQTIVSEEYPQAYEAGRNERYYPVPDAKNHELYRRYRRKADGLEKVYFAGRLGDYKYYNMDEAVKRALELFEEIR
jgi:UDP-galactopyranose mutase